MHSEPSPPGAVLLRVQGAGKVYRLFAHPVQRLLHHVLGAWGPQGQAFTALEPLSFELRRGQTLGIVGVNGSGKSTLLQLVAQTLRPTQGQVQCTGRIAALLELGAGFDPELTGRANAALLCALYGLDAATVSRKLPDILAFAEIGDFIDQPVKIYSSGMFVRLAFAVVAHVDADILLIDEALAVGDAYFAQKCMRFLHAFRQQGAVLFVSHDLAAVKALASEVLWLDHGCERGRGSPKDIGDAYWKSQYARSQSVERADEPADVNAQTPIGTGAEVHMSQDTGGPEGTPPASVWSAGSSEFGAGGASIVAVTLQGADAQSVAVVQGGESVCLDIRVRAEVDLFSPIVGFFVRNRLGLNVFGDNTYLRHRDTPLHVAQGSGFVGRFRFVMPYLPRGDYSVCAAVATGSNQDHVQHHWVNEALLLRSVASDVHADVLGIPMLESAIHGLGGK